MFSDNCLVPRNILINPEIIWVVLLMERSIKEIKFSPPTNCESLLTRTNDLQKSSTEAKVSLCY